MREVVEIPLARTEVVEHVYVDRMRALCRKRVLPEYALRGLAVGRKISYGIHSTQGTDSASAFGST